MLKKIYSINWLLIFLITILAFIGFIALYSASDSNFELWTKKQIIRFVISIFLLFLISLLDIRFFYKNAYLIFILTLFLLLSVEFFGIFGGGSTRWIRIFNLSIQPSELVKVSLILFLARYYHDLRYDRIHYIRVHIIPLIGILFPFILIILQPDLGTALILLLLGITLMFLVGVKIWKFILSFFMVLVLMPTIWRYVLEDYQKKRLISFINPESDPLGAGYHLIQSKIALGSGGLYGKGFLKGSQSYLEYLPEKQTDFIFTHIGEEFGFIGTMFVLSLYSSIILICFYIAVKSLSTFGRILSVGVGINLFLYVICNTAMVIGLMPVVGVPLPLLSYGGSVMISIMISFGLLLNIDLNYRQKKFL